MTADAEREFRCKRTHLRPQCASIMGQAGVIKLKGNPMNRLTNVVLITILFCSVPTGLAQDKKTGDKGSSKAASHVKAKYDKGKNLTTVTLKSMDLGGSMTRESTNLSQVTQLTLDVSFTYAGEQKAKPVESLTMKFTSRARYPVYQRAQNLMVG